MLDGTSHACRQDYCCTLWIVSCAGARLVSFEKAFQWAMAGKRFLWQVWRALLGALPLSRHLTVE